MTRAQKPLRARRNAVQLAEVAFRELSLPGSLHSKADEARLWRIFRGLEWLDNEQVRIKTAIDDLLEAYEANPKIDALIEGLRKLTKPINEEAAKEYERDLVTLSFGDALTMISDRMEDIEDFDEMKIKALLELLIDKPVKITSANPRKK